MRISLSVNGISRTTASLPRAGYLNAHLNLSERPKDGTSSKTIRVVATDTSNDTETLSFAWPEIALTVGDVIELRILPEGDGDAPTKTSRSSDAPSNLLTNSELARDVIHDTNAFSTRLADLLSRAEGVEPREEYEKFRTAVGYVLFENGAKLLYPIYRRHKELIPDALKGTIL